MKQETDTLDQIQTQVENMAQDVIAETVIPIPGYAFRVIWRGREE